MKNLIGIILKIKLRMLWVYFLFNFILILTSCSNLSDPGGQFFWMIIGFPLLGVAFFIGEKVLSMFPSILEGKKSNSNLDQTTLAIIIGVVILYIFYSLFKNIF